MKAWIFIFCFPLPVCLPAQQKLPGNAVVRPLLNDTARVDSLNAYSYQYTVQSLKDSAEYYATAAYRMAGQIHYIHGLAEALSRKAGIAEHFYNNFVLEGKLAEESVSWFQKTGNKANLPIAYSQLAFSYFVYGAYDKAMRLEEKCYDLYSKSHDESGKWDVLTMIGSIYIKKGEFDKGFDVIKKSLQIATKSGDQSRIKGCLICLGSLCMAIEDYPLALHYYRSVFENFTREDFLVQSMGEFDVWAKMEFAEIYSHLNMFDSALYYYNLFDPLHAPEKDLRIFLVSKGEYFMQTHEYKKALASLHRGLLIHLKLLDNNEIMRTQLDIAKTYLALQNDKQALLFGREGLRLALQTDNRQFTRDGYKVLSSVYDSRGQTDSAYFYYRSYIAAKESLTNDQTKGKFAAYNYEQKIELLNNEKLINRQQLKIQEQQLKNETLFRNILAAIVLTVLLVSFLLIRNIFLKRRNEKLKSENIQRELQNKTAEMEMQALRAQINPHFIFNCLNSINRFIMKNESQAASDYLTQFSRLIRLVLNNSKKAWIPLEDEIEMLSLYMDMEKLRFKDAFNYLLRCDKNADLSCIFIPPLLLQPFVENAIWHGLMHKKGIGLVTISFELNKDILYCTVTDNGIGRSRAEAIGSKSSKIHKSMGIQITRERLELINGQPEDKKVAFHIEDLFDSKGQPSGTRVSLQIKFQKNNDQQKEFHTFLKPANHDSGYDR
jgi:tetratricopeptide (TPR) repeat protein